MRKAQAVITDLFIALAIFVMLIVIIVYLWNDYSTRLSEDVEYERIQLIAYQITNQLIKTQGVPKAWEKNPSSFSEIGLATSDRKLSAEKVDSFVNLPYDTVRDALNLEGYGYSFKIKTLSNKALKSSGGTPEETETVGLERYVIYNNEKSILEFKIWKKK